MDENEALQAIQTVLDKLFAPADGLVEFVETAYQRSHGMRLPSLTSEEVVAAREALSVLRSREANN